MIYMTTSYYYEPLEVMDRSSPMLTIAKQTTAWGDRFRFGPFPREGRIGIESSFLY
jgi:hypothetical protein